MIKDKIFIYCMAIASACIFSKFYVEGNLGILIAILGILIAILMIPILIHDILFKVSKHNEKTPLKTKQGEQY